MKRFIVFALICVLVLVYVETAQSQSMVDIVSENTLNIKVSKTVFFSIDKSVFNGLTGFELLDGQNKLPLSFIENGNTIIFKTYLNFNPLEKKNLKLVYGVSNPRYVEFFIPDYFGTHFIIPTSCNVNVFSSSSDNNVKIVKKDTNKLYFDITLHENNFKTLKLLEDGVYELVSNKPVLVSISTLTAPFDKDSSDDISSLYGTYFGVYVPKFLFIFAQDNAHIRVEDSDGKIVTESDIAKGSFYINTNLKEGFYIISSDKPVLVEYGYASDNVFATIFGVGNVEFESFGGFGVSSIFKDTEVIVEFGGEKKTFTLKNVNDFEYFETQPDETEDNTLKMIPVKVSASKSVLIYAYGVYGNTDAEQLPGFSDFNKYNFRTGKVTNIYGERKRRVVVIPVDNNTSFYVNGAKYTQGAFEKKEFLFNKSFSKVDISSNKQVVVFDLGIAKNREIFSTLIPYKTSEFIKVSTIAPSQDSENSTVNNPSPSDNKPTQEKSFLEKVKGAILSVAGKIMEFFKNTFSKFDLTYTFGVIVAFFKNISLKILEFLKPLSLQIYNYTKNYFPNLTPDLISSIISVAVLLILLIILFPKRHEKKLKEVPLKEIKKKPIAFDVKDIEIREIEKPVEEAKPVEEKAEVPLVKLKPEEKAPVKDDKKIAEEQIAKEEKILRPIPQKRFGEKPIIEPTKIIKPSEKKEEKPIIKVEKEEKPIIKVEKVKEKEEEPLPKVEEVVEKQEKPVIKVEEVKGKEEVPQTNPVEAVEEVSFADFAQPPEDTETLKKTREVKKEEEVTEEKKETFKKEQFRSTFDELLSKLEKEKQEQTENKEAVEPIKEDVSKAKEEKLISETHVKIELKDRFVIDATSFRKIFESGKLSKSEKDNILNRAFIAASEKAKINDIILEGGYKPAVIALSQIEERLAEDIAKRIGSNVITAFNILIAKKIRVSDVVVDDNPKIKNYQNTKIILIEEMI
ncbi:MAG: hypothetical protein K6343_04285 [Caldisericaceae bacterium]